MTRVVVPASKLASLIVQPEESSEEDLIFGKIFEEEYTKLTWLYTKTFANGKYLRKMFLRTLAARLKASGFNTKLVRTYTLKASRMSAALIKNGVTGRKPKTEFRHYNNEIVISAQPDLIKDEIVYYEFKTYPLNKYALLQTKIFAWVVGKDIKLIGLKSNSEGFYKIEQRTIKVPKNLSRYGISDALVYKAAELYGIVQEFCEHCGRPEEKCKCAFYRYFYYYDNEDWDDDEDTT